MRVFSANYFESGSLGGFREKEAVVVVDAPKDFPSAEDVALSMVLQYYPDTRPKDWSFEEIDLNQPNVHHITALES